MFESEQFISDCRAALAESDPQAAINELVKKAVNAPGEIMRALGEPELAGVETIYRAPDLTILNLHWGPRMDLFPHDHRMWAVIGIYGGREDNWESIIHSVCNPLDKMTSAIHVYGGDFFDTPRSEWDPETFEEHPYDVAHAMQVFEDSNKLLRELAGD
jgi:predicted metal-dependent enzyme (double-stranded beta helix superfamily)